MRPFLAEPADGRVFGTRRLVRSTEVTPDGRLRLDALARYLQAAAEDDLADAGGPGPFLWLVRRTAVTVGRFPRLAERIEVRTFCSGTGPCWAERTTTISGSRGGLVQAVAVWAAVSRDDGRPAELGPRFHEVYGAAAGGRTVSARLTHPRPPAGVPAVPWPLRAADFDPAGHVNNAIHWAAAEDVLAGLDWLPTVAEMEYYRPVRPGAATALATARDPAPAGPAGPAAPAAGPATPGGVSAWLLDADGQRLASARLTPPADGSEAVR
jgi:acyl-ACP thioesterase